MSETDNLASGPSAAVLRECTDCRQRQPLAAFFHFKRSRNPRRYCRGCGDKRRKQGGLKPIDPARRPTAPSPGLSEPLRCCGRCGAYLPVSVAFRAGSVTCRRCEAL